MFAVRADGTEFPVEVAVTPIRSGGRPMFTSFIRDLTERKEAEETLRRTEEQLRQAVKMEAIGRLAGGVAHDFNNLLTVINCYGEQILLRLGPDSPWRTPAEGIVKAGLRAAALTRQLLAFSRKQRLETRVFDL